MEVYILNEQFEKVCIIDSYKSFIWVDRFDIAGDFELYIPLPFDNYDYIQKDMYVSILDSNKYMIIENIEITTDYDEGDFLCVTGRSLESILSRRIVWDKTVLTGSLQDGIHQLLNDAIISPSDSSRAIPNFIFKESTNPAITKLTVEAEYHTDNLYDVIPKLCSTNKIGFKIELNSNNQFVFELYIGTDYSYSQNERPYVVFSPKYDNLISSRYLDTNEKYKNAVLMKYRMSNHSYDSYDSIGSGVGLDRRECYIDVGTIDRDASVIQKGLEELDKLKVETSTEGEIEPTIMYTYGEDYIIGDIVQLEDEYGHKGRVYISEFIYSVDTKAISCYPTFTKYEEKKEGETV